MKEEYEYEYELEPRGDFHDFDEDEINRKRITDNKVKGIAFDYLKSQLELSKETLTDESDIFVIDKILKMLNLAYERALELCGFN